MPRVPRQKSESGIYHIMLRGINQQNIFEDEKDYLKFISLLTKYKSICGYKLFAYCLMSNHIHILLKTEKEDLDLIMKRIAGSYAYFYNSKYYRSRHLFQDRFKSEAVENDSYFLTVIRYIHQNPVKAGLVQSIDEYPYSSYNDFFKSNSTVVNTDFVLSIIDKENFAIFNNETNDDDCLDVYEYNYRLNDNDARRIIQKIIKNENINEIHKMEETKRNKCIKEMRESGLSIRQISRLTSISRGIIDRIR